ncbi:glycosyltransferase [Halomonadaceae bacterium KBTZ08]
MNNRGLGTESRLLRDFFKAHFPDVDFQIYQIPAGRKGKDFDATWHTKRSFLRWLNSKDVVMTIEQFMPNLFQACRERGIRTIWRPNHEWIPPHYGQEDFRQVDIIMAPQHACADLLEQHFGLRNVVRNPWITELPIQEKQPSRDKTLFLFNAGRGGLGERRNHQVVIDAFSKVLAERDDIHFTLKTQTDLDVSPLAPFRGESFTYSHRNTSYRKNLAYYRSADFSVAPSKWEGVGFAILESLYCGTPVLTTDAPPMNEWVRHQETGYLVPATYPDLALPIPHDRINLKGVNWVRAALCEVNDVVEGIHWLADNKDSVYEQFNNINGRELAQRKSDFIACFRALIDNGFQLDRAEAGTRSSTSAID